MIECKKTAAEMLEYYKIEVFGKMGIDIEGLQDKDTAYQYDPGTCPPYVANKIIGSYFSIV